MMVAERLVFDIDGEWREAMIEPSDLLVDVLRDDFGIMSIECDFELGQTGASTVLIDGVPALASLTLALIAAGRSITTAEGLKGDDGGAHPLVAAFRKHGVMDLAGASGLLVAAAGLLVANPRPTEEDVRRGFSGNLVHGTGYRHVIAAVLDAATHIIHATEVTR